MPPMVQVGIRRLLAMRLGSGLLPLRHKQMRWPTYSQPFATYARSTQDPVRIASIGLALATIEREAIDGDLAELGVWRGDTSVILHHLAPERALHLFDTFAGF